MRGWGQETEKWRGSLPSIRIKTVRETGSQEVSSTSSRDVSVPSSVWRDLPSWGVSYSVEKQTMKVRVVSSGQRVLGAVCLLICRTHHVTSSEIPIGSQTSPARSPCAGGLSALPASHWWRSPNPAGRCNKAPGEPASLPSQPAHSTVWKSTFVWET